MHLVSHLRWGSGSRGGPGGGGPGGNLLYMVYLSLCYSGYKRFKEYNYHMQKK
jgi:hypothetical protein